MKVATSAQMRAIDKKTIEGYGIPAEALMERAGAATAGKIRELFRPQKTIVLAGPGNNGGDGAVVARELYNAGWPVRLIVLFKERDLGADCAGQTRTARESGVPLEFRKSIDAKDTQGALVVDAIFGTGLKRPVSGHLLGVISFLNGSGSPVVSVDIPSGVSSDTGKVLGIAVRADYTVTFGLPKRGHYLYPGAGLRGKLFVADIGFPAGLIEDPSIPVRVVQKEDITIPKRPPYSHKGNYGHVLLVAGSKGKTGAALMAGRACLRAGAGLLTIAAPESIMPVIESRVTEEMTLALPEKKSGGLSPKAAGIVLEFMAQKADVLAIGPGIGVSKETGAFVKKVLNGLKGLKTLSVLDADAINALTKKDLQAIKKPFVLTPHPGEMARLLGVSAKDIEKDRIETALSFSAANEGSVLVLKGAPTVTAGDGEAFINTTGNSGMAKAGTGDALTGMIAALIGQGLSPIDAAVTGAYLHGLAGDLAAQRTGLHSLMASDLIEAIPEAFLKISGDGWNT